MQGARWVLALLAALVMVACGGSDKKYYVPVDSPAKPFVAPETEDLVPEEDDGWGMEDDDDDGGEDATPKKEAPEKPKQPTTRAAPPPPTPPAPNTKPTPAKKK